MSDAVNVTINGRPIEARKGELVIAAAQRHDIYIPLFCYHERMNPVGMCPGSRQSMSTKMRTDPPAVRTYSTLPPAIQL